MFELGLKNKVAIITGGSDGLGFASAKLLSKMGSKVVVCGRRGKYLKEKARSISTITGNEVLDIQADVSDQNDCKQLVEKTVKEFKKIDILLNNAGTSAALEFEKVTDDQWEEDINLKLMSSVRMSRLVIPHMKKNSGGSIINASISGGKSPNSGSLPTTVSRAAGLNLTKSLANEFAKDNIRVNAICIGLIKSAQWERRAGNNDLSKFYQNLSKGVPIGKNRR